MFGFKACADWKTILLFNCYFVVMINNTNKFSLNQDLFLYYITALIFLLTNVRVSDAQNIVSGMVKDGQTERALEFSQVLLLNPADSSMVNGGITGVDGRFHLEINQSGEYLLNIRFVGYQEAKHLVRVEPGENDLGAFYLLSAATELGEVEVSSVAALFRSEADRRIYNVEQMTIAEGGTTIQLLEALPSVQVDEEGNISLRGSGNIQIYINGRPTSLFSDDTESVLEQYPASLVKEVELITNPSARYEAEGVGGIINIILREERMQGFNGRINLSSGTGHKYNGGINLNYRTNNWNFFGNYSYQYREMWEQTNSFRENFISDFSPVLDQDYYNENWIRGQMLRTGVQYNINGNTSIQLYSNINRSSRDRERTYNIRSMSFPLALDSLYIRNLDEDQSQVNYEFGWTFNWQNDNGHRLSALFTYAFGEQDRIEYFDQQFFDAGLTEIPEKHADQFYERPLNNRMIVAQADYRHNFSDDMHMETGVRTYFRYDERGQNFGQLDRATGEYHDIILNGIPVSNDFTHDRQIHGAYVTLTDNRGSLNYLVGLRGEYTHMESWQDYGLRSGFLDDEHFIPARDTITTDSYFRLFPSVFLSYELPRNQDIQASYSRRIRRPGIGSMMPFLNAQDFFNLRLGNPYLHPSHTDNYEINYLRGWQRFMLSAGVFHRRTTDDHSRLFVLFDKGSLVTWTNANTQNATGVEVIQYLDWSNNLDLTLTGNFFYSEVSSEVEGRQFSNKRYSWTLNLQGSVNIPGWFSSQVSANYWGPRVIPQGEIKPVFSLSAGLRRNVLNNQGTISLNVTDIFNSRKFSLSTTNDQFFQHREFFRESRVLTLGFIYRFGGFRERDNGVRDNSFERDIEGLY